MSKRGKDGRSRKKEKKKPPQAGLVVDLGGRRVSLGDDSLSFNSIMSFFGLAKLGKMVRFGLDETGRAVVVQAVPDKIESFYSEIVRLLYKYKDDPVKGFKEIEGTILFAKSKGVIDGS